MYESLTLVSYIILRVAQPKLLTPKKLSKMAQTTITDGIKMLVARHAATEGCEVGSKAIAAVKKISNADPSEGVWAENDQFTIPAKEEIEQAVFVAMVNGNKAPAIAVETTTGVPKVLYISSLKKNVIEYEEDGDQFVVKKQADGSNVPPHFADTEFRKEIMKKATVGDIIDFLAGKTLKVTKIMGPFKTSRLKAKTDALGRRDGYEVVGLRNTSIPVFEEVK
jgi:hypothetical protein